MNIWAALGFMLLGGVIDRVFASREWSKYYEGRREEPAHRKGRPT